MKVLAVPPQTAFETEPTADLVRDELERLLAQECFRDSPTQQRLLSYIVTETLGGNGRNLKEYTFGVAVFRRGDDFDPRTDSIVRVQIGVLRKKLAAYYKDAGRLDSVVIDVPRGQYAAQFTMRDPSGESEVPPPEVKGPWRPGIREVGLVLLGLAIGVALWLPLRGRDPARTAPFAWRNHPIWEGFFEPGSSTQLVVGAPMFVNFAEIYVRDSLVNAPDDLEQSSKMRRLGETLHVKGRPEEIYTGLGEAAGLYTLGRFFADGNKQLPLIRNRLARWQDFAHSNVILLSSFRFRTLSQQLDLPHDFEFDIAQAVIHNRRPRSGEEKLYRPVVVGGERDYDFAVVSVWPSPQSGRRIMTISGAYTWGTQGAADYVVDPPNLSDLAARLAVDRPRKGNAGLQVLLKVLIKDRQPVAASYVTHHWLSGEARQ